MTLRPPAARLLLLTAALLVASAGPSAQTAAPGETVRVRRLNDTVAVRQGPDGVETVLYPFSPTADLATGDEVEQGSGGQSTLILSGGGLVDLYRSGHMVLERLDEQGDVLRFPVLTMAEIEAGTRPLEVYLPGGTHCALEGGVMTVRVEPGRLRIRNDGGSAIRVTGVLTLEAGKTGGEGLSTLVLERGGEVHIPLFRTQTPPLGSQLGGWSELSLRHSGGVALEPRGTELWVRPSRPDARDVLTVGGVRVTVGTDRALVLHRARPGPVGSPSADPAGPPPGYTAISLEEYYQARLIGLQAGLTVPQIEESLAKRLLWVSPSLKAEFEEWVSRQAGTPAEESDADKEDSSP